MGTGYGEVGLTGVNREQREVECTLCTPVGCPSRVDLCLPFAGRYQQGQGRDLHLHPRGRSRTKVLELKNTIKKRKPHWMCSVRAGVTGQNQWACPEGRLTEFTQSKQNENEQNPGTCKTTKKVPKEKGKDCVQRHMISQTWHKT